MLVLAAFLLAALGCRNESAAPPRTPLVTDGPRDSVLPKLQTAMANAGHECKSMEKARLLCVSKDSTHLRFLILPIDSPIRTIAVVAAFKLKVPCTIAYARMNKLNYDVDVVKTSCDDSGAFVAVGALVVPEGGLTGTDVSRFVEKWIGVFSVAFNAYGLVEVLE